MCVQEKKINSLIINTNHNMSGLDLHGVNFVQKY